MDCIELPPARLTNKPGQTQRTALLLECLAEAGLHGLRREVLDVLTRRIGNEHASRSIAFLLDGMSGDLPRPSTGSVRNWRMNVADLNGDWRQPLGAA